MKKKWDVIILGGGPAGYTAALYVVRSGLKALVIEKLVPGGQMILTSKIDNYPGFELGITGNELSEKIKDTAERFGVETVITSVSRVQIGGSEKRMITGKGEFVGSAVVLAAGAYPRELGVPGEKEAKGKGVSYCAICDGMFFKGKKVLVIGGGNSAAEDGTFLSGICREVLMSYRGDKLKVSQVYLQAIADSTNIRLLPCTKVRKIFYDGKVQGVEIEDTRSGACREEKCEGVFVAAGRVPDTDMFKGQIELDENGYIIADETTCTNIPGVFAAGDIRTKPVRQIITAAADGAAAAEFVYEYLRRNQN